MLTQRSLHYVRLGEPHFPTTANKCIVISLSSDPVK